MDLAELIALNLAIVLAIMVAVWALSVVLRDVSIVDIVWGLGFAGIAAVTCLLSSGDAGRKALLVCLTAVWGLRLAVYLAWRKAGAPEDARYRALRERIGPSFWLVSLAVVFGLQGVLMTIVALPVIAGQQQPAPPGVLALVGTAVWATGIGFEAVGDWQLARFKANPANRGRVLDRGLWRYTRHPNYFGDCLVWWGLYLAALTEDTWWTAVGPALMTFLLMRVSGVTLLEQSLQHTKEGYADYMARTSAFLPWPPRAH